MRAFAKYPFLLLATLLVVAGCDQADPAPPPPPDPVQAYRYEVRGFGAYPATTANSIQYRDADGLIYAETDVTLPWSKIVRFEDDEQVRLYLRAQAIGPANQVGLTIRVVFDGDVLDSRSNDGLSSGQQVTNDLNLTLGG
ncbi:MAG TPA: MmpS family transport accessory protein [Rubricoccaceae bacterium]|nr:MmpS family transport accessory protein [Rubricoccaceae bacterium]